MSHRIYIFGPSGSGTTTLAQALASKIGIFHLDTDDFYWQQTPIPYTKVHPIEARIENIREQLLDHQSWIISGCMCSWGEAILAEVTHVVYIWLPWDIRKSRLIAREEGRYGKASIADGGERHVLFQKFIQWAEQYDSADVTMRSRARHEVWIKRVNGGVKVLRLEDDVSVAERVAKVTQAL